MGAARVKRHQNAAAVEAVKADGGERIVPLSQASALRIAQSWAASQGATAAAQAAVGAANAARVQHNAAVTALLEALGIDHEHLQVDVRIDKGVLVLKPKADQSPDAPEPS